MEPHRKEPVAMDSMTQVDGPIRLGLDVARTFYPRHVRDWAIWSYGSTARIVVDPAEELVIVK
jgi:hypothetical protein